MQGLVIKKSPCIFIFFKKFHFFSFSNAVLIFLRYNKSCKGDEQHGN